MFLSTVKAEEIQIHNIHSYFAEEKDPVIHLSNSTNKTL